MFVAATFMTWLVLVLGGWAAFIVLSWRAVSEYRFRRAQRMSKELLRRFNGRA